MRVILKTCFAVMLFINVLHAGNKLTSSFEFLRTDFSPRMAAMSGSNITLRGDVNSLQINPAGGAFIEQEQFTFNYTNYLLDINGGLAAYARPFPGIGILHASILYMDYGDFTRTDDYAVPVGGTFSANDFALSFGISGNLDADFTYGVNLKYIYSKIEDYQASAAALDFGLLWAVPFEKDLFVGVNLLNVGSNFEYYNKIQEPLPLSVGIGFSKKLEHLPLEITASLRDLNIESDNLWDRLKRAALGGEFTVSKTLRLRLGYNYELQQNLQSAADNKFGGVSGGAGIYWKKYRFDYSYSNYNFLGSVHRFGVWGTL